jgi:hypothetical protein
LTANLLDKYDKYLIIFPPEIGDPNPPLRAKLKLDYSVRQFEIEMRTSKAIKCPVCLKVDVDHGIFMNNANVQSIQRKQYCKEINTIIATGVTTSKYKFKYPSSMLTVNDDISITIYEPLKDVCKKCAVNIVKIMLFLIDFDCILIVII